MSDPAPGERDGDERLDMDDPFEVPEDVEEAWEGEEQPAEGEAPSG